MDPNETLRQLRELVAELPEYAVGDEPASELAELFDALDKWMTSGGMSPTAWKWSHGSQGRVNPADVRTNAFGLLDGSDNEMPAEYHRD